MHDVIVVVHAAGAPAAMLLAGVGSASCSSTKISGQRHDAFDAFRAAGGCRLLREWGLLGALEAVCPAFDTYVLVSAWRWFVVHRRRWLASAWLLSAATGARWDLVEAAVAAAWITDRGPECWM